MRLFLRSGEHTVRLDEDAAHRLRRSFAASEPCDSVLEGSFLLLDGGAVDGFLWHLDARQPSLEAPHDRLLRQRGGLLFRDGWLHALKQLAPEGAQFSMAGLVAWRAAALVVFAEDSGYDETRSLELLAALAHMWEGVGDPENMRTSDFASGASANGADDLSVAEPDDDPGYEDAEQEVDDGAASTSVNDTEQAGGHGDEPDRPTAGTSDDAASDEPDW